MLHERSRSLPTLRGSNQRVATPATYFRPPGRPCRKESQNISLIPFRIPWIATAVGCQSTHARVRSSSRGGQPALASTRAPGARDHCRATGPRVYKSPWNPRPQKGNRPPCLQKFLDLEPSRATGPRDYHRVFSARDHCRATGRRVYKSSSTGPSGDNQSRRNPDLPV